jgi:hypothetical protein
MPRRHHLPGAWPKRHHDRHLGRPLQEVDYFRHSIHSRLGYAHPRPLVPPILGLLAVVAAVAVMIPLRLLGTRRRGRSAR